MTIRRFVAVGGLIACSLIVTLLSCDKAPTLIPPLCALSTSDLSFGTVVVGETKDLPLTIRNDGGSTVEGTVHSCGDFHPQGDSTYSLGDHASTSITIRFAPSAAGARNCDLPVGDGCAKVACAGTGALTACQLSSVQLDFGTSHVGGPSVDRSFTITNLGNAVLSGSISSPCADYTIQSAAAYNLGTGLSSSFTVRFTPTVSGTVTCTLNTGSATCSSVSLTAKVLELDSGNVNPNQTYSHTFAVAGTYLYHCEIHNVMKGSVVVDASGPASVSVDIVGNSSPFFNPTPVTVAPGGTVTWTNRDVTAHTVTSD